MFVEIGPQVGFDALALADKKLKVRCGESLWTTFRRFIHSGQQESVALASDSSPYPSQLWKRAIIRFRYYPDKTRDALQRSMRLLSLPQCLSHASITWWRAPLQQFPKNGDNYTWRRWVTKMPSSPLTRTCSRKRGI